MQGMDIQWQEDHQRSHRFAFNLGGNREFWTLLEQAKDAWPKPDRITGFPFVDRRRSGTPRPPPWLPIVASNDALYIRPPSDKKLYAAKLKRCCTSLFLNSEMITSAESIIISNLPLYLIDPDLWQWYT